MGKISIAGALLATTMCFFQPAFAQENVQNALHKVTATATGLAELSDKEIQEIALKSYLYFYPLVLSDVTRNVSTNVSFPEQIFGSAPMNMFANNLSYPPVEDKIIVRTNFDTLYSTAWIDLSKEPMVVSVPDTHGRYYLLPMYDMWTDSFASPGKRTTGTKAAKFLVAASGWKGKVPKGMELIVAPTPTITILGRIQTNGPKDYDEVHKIQAGLKLIPLSQWGRPAQTVKKHKTNPAIDMKTPPKAQVEAMDAPAFFTYAEKVFKAQAPHLTDYPILEQMKRIGLVPGKQPDFSKLDPKVQKALADIPQKAQDMMDWAMSHKAPIVNHWVFPYQEMGVYGDDYLQRALIAKKGIFANLPEDSVYASNLADADGHPLNGANHYKIHFEKDQLPPVGAFWSVTLYDRQGYAVPNELKRYNLSSWQDFTKNADGSFDLYFQHENPGKDKEGNWLPAPKGNFNLLLRLYAPEEAITTGQWKPPLVTLNK